MPKKAAKKKPADPIAKLAARVAVLEYREAARNVAPQGGDRLASEMLQEDVYRLRGERLATVRRSLGLSRRPWRDLLPRWLERLLDRCGGL